jgi:4-amino-4-deoxy-L-arabinose transferase-like glycosyltransferase
MTTTARPSEARPRPGGRLRLRSRRPAGPGERRAEGAPVPSDPRWVKLAFGGLLVFTAALYLIGLGRSGWANDFYAAAVQAGTKSWKAMFFGSFDASNAITVDKPPASLWVMDISARIFGLSSWSLLVPQALEGVAAVALLYAAVKRWFGPAAGLLAGAVLATTPVAALMFRFDNPDALLVLLLVAGAYAVTRAIEDGRTRWLVLAGALVGLGFLTKMLQAFLVLPAFGAAYLVAGPPRLGRRVWQLAAGTLALLAAAGWWVAIVALIPASARPYAGGSTDNSVLGLALGYNGLGRLTGSETGSVGGGTGGFGWGGATGITRLFSAEMGGQAAWLIPAALVALAGLAWATRRQARTSHARAAILLWGGWLLVTAGVFSYMAGIFHPYYTVALAPAIGALVGIGAATAWRERHSRLARGVLAAMLGVTVVSSFVLLSRSPGWYPWVRVLIVVAGAVAVTGVLAGERAVRLAAAAAGGAAAGSAAVPRRAGVTLAATVASAGLVAGLAGQTAYSVQTAATVHTGAIPSAGPSVTAAFAGGRRGPGGFGGRNAPGGQRLPVNGALPGNGAFPGNGAAPGAAPGSAAGTAGPRAGGLSGATQVSRALVALLKSGASGYRWAAAIVGATSAAPLQLSSGEPVMAIGGFNGTDPAPTLAQFEKRVAAHEIHYFAAAPRGGFGGSSSGSSAQITSWVEQHFSGTTVGGYTVYDLSSGTSGSST